METGPVKGATPDPSQKPSTRDQRAVTRPATRGVLDGSTSMLSGLNDLNEELMAEDLDPITRQARDYPD